MTEQPEPLARDVAEKFSPGGWTFDEDVAEAFDAHVEASVPHYAVFQDLVAQAADWLLPDGGTVADLGASTGTTVAGIFDRHPERKYTAHLYDDSRPMIERGVAKFREKFDEIPDGRMWVFHERRLQSGPPLEHERADLTLALFVLQFLRQRDREVVLRRARDRADDRDGALLVAEKIRIPDARWSEIANDLSHDWKAEHGISGQAIYAKARSLRGVLRPGTFGELTDAVVRAGWQPPTVLFRWHSWVLLGAFASAST